MNIQWLAGFFDGEGCVHLRLDTRKKAVYSLQIMLTQNDESVLREVQKEFGGTVYKHDKRRCWRWRITSAPSLAFLEAIQPYVIIKKEQVELAIQFIRTVRKENLGSTPMGDDVCVKRTFINNRLRELKTL